MRTCLLLCFSLLPVAHAQNRSFMHYQYDVLTYVTWSTTKSTSGMVQQLSPGTDAKGRPFLQVLGGTFELASKGKNLTLQFTQGSWGKVRWMGVLEKNTLSLRAIDPQGGVNTFSMREASVTQYNKAVANLKQKITLGQQKWDQQTKERERINRLLTQASDAQNRIDVLVKDTLSYEQQVQGAILDLKVLPDDLRASSDEILTEFKANVTQYSQARTCEEQQLAVEHFHQTASTLQYHENLENLQQEFVGPYRQLITTGKTLYADLQSTFKAYNTALADVKDLLGVKYRPAHLYQLQSRITQSQLRLQTALTDYDQQKSAVQQALKSAETKTGSLVVPSQSCRP